MEIRIELGRDDKNINPFFEPLGLARRGIWRKANVPPTQQGDVATVPDLPGYIIACDPDKGTIRYYDPLRTHPKRAEIEAAMTRFLRKPFRLEPEQSADVGKSQIRRHILWMYILVDAGNAQLREGKWPEWVAKQRETERDADAKRIGRTDEQIAESKEKPVELVQTSD